jgi:hypothetical protein
MKFEVFTPVQMESDYTVKTNQLISRNGGHILDFIYPTYNLIRPYHISGSLIVACHHKALGSMPGDFT